MMIKTDALIIGAGPTGLFTAHQLKLIGLNCEVVDNLDKIGGQCIELYPDKPIYDIPAVPECTGEQLTKNLLEQIKPFKTNFHLDERVQEISKEKNNWKIKTKEENFIGKEELIKRKNNPQKKIVGLELSGKEIAGHGDCVHISRSQVGVVTSGCLSSTLNKNIALCRIDMQYSEIGTEVEVGKIDGHQKRIAAKVVAFPFYDPTKSRVRS